MTELTFRKVMLSAGYIVILILLDLVLFSSLFTTKGGYQIITGIVFTVMCFFTIHTWEKIVDL